MENQEIIDLLLQQIKDRDDIIKSISQNTNDIVKHHEIADKHKNINHRNTILWIMTCFAISITIIVCTFIICYFTCDFKPAQINGDGNVTNSESVDIQK